MIGTLDELTMKEKVERLGKSVGQAKTAIFDTIDDSTTAAARLLKRGQYAVEDAVHDSAHGIRRKPISSVALAFAGGLAVGVLASCLRRD